MVERGVGAACFQNSQQRSDHFSRPRHGNRDDSSVRDAEWNAASWTATAAAAASAASAVSGALALLVYQGRELFSRACTLSIRPEMNPLYGKEFQSQ